jgi:L-threonylcarbamoyladenylate synthase
VNASKTRIVPADDPEVIRIAWRLLRSGEVVAFPTDTVYGVGADAFSPGAVSALYLAKLRPTTKAIPILVARIEDIKRVACNIPKVAWQLAERFWPGGLTMVLPRAQEVPSVVSAGSDTVAVRCPDHSIPLALMEKMDAPLAASSANLSGEPSPTTACQVLEQLSGRVRLIIDGGECPGGVPSTLVDLSGSRPYLLRTGAIPVEDLCDILPDLVL